jgi:excisionase family DNA binding protein
MSGDDDLLTTGEAAALLGTTARHVVQLCDRGELPYRLAGSHRRVRRADVEALAGRAAISQGGPMTEDQLRSLWLGRVAAAEVARDPDKALETARETALSFLSKEPAGAQWLRDWLALIDRGPEAVMRALTSTSPFSRELRQNSPFSGLIPDAERRQVIAAFRSARGNGR